jgi:signal transduction histidine kinase/DNA-binding response OmpR family regulator
MWETFVEHNMTLLIHGETEKARVNLGTAGAFSIYQKSLLEDINTLSTFATAKAESIYAASTNLKRTITLQLVLLIAAIFILSVIISYLLTRNIRKPLKEINGAVTRFHDGDMDARSNYSSKNDFGILASSINMLASLVQENTQLHKMRIQVVNEMLSEDEQRSFFQNTLNVLAEVTGAQIAAVYLLSKNGKQYEHYESIGLDSGAKQAFAADSGEGELGAAVFTKKLQHIKNIQADTRLTYKAVTGTYIPREIITIPIVSGGRVVAVFSLANLKEFAPISVELLNNIYVTMCARITGILAFEEIRDYQLSLEMQNRELDDQKSELVAQAAEMFQQNTELEVQKRQLGEASRLKTNFLSNMSHELRTPLNSIIALSAVLSRRLNSKIPAEEYKYLDIIERNGKNLLLLINDILDISRIESGHEETEISNFNICGLIDDTLVLLHEQAVQKGITLSFDSSALPELYISSDYKKCSHILQNIVSNAVKFTEKGGVSVSLQKLGDRFELKVTDTGIGISSDDLPHIFDEFRQADSSISKRFGGTGLGLAIVKKYVAMLGGTISASSVLDQGTTFTITLPIFSSVETADEHFDEPLLSLFDLPDASRDRQDKTILLVDDNESATIQIKDLVLEMGYNVLIAHGAEEAFSLIEQKVPDAMVLDIMMPDIDGLSLLATLRNAERTANIPVLVLTAKHITKDELKFLKRNNVHQLIQKGDVDVAKLKSAITLMLYPELLKKPVTKEKPKIEGKPCVLIVEDNPDNLTTVKALLGDNFILHEAVNGEEGVIKAAELVPDLILMDIALPIKNGIEAYNEIRKSQVTRHIPVIALTSNALVEDRSKILSQGFDAFIAKPIDEKLLLKVIHEVLYGE